MGLHDAVPTISFHRAGGGVLTLGPAGSSEQIRLVHGAQGLGAAPVSLSTSPRLAGHGSVVRGSRLGERDIFLPVRIQAPSMSELNTTRARLLGDLSPLDGRELTLRVATPGGRWREIPVHYTGGLEGDYGDGYHGTWQTLGLEFKAPEGLWRGEPVSISKQVDPGSKPFLSATEPFFPVMLADSTVAGRISVTVTGDAPTFPVWTITPPGSDLTIRHVESGTRFYLDGLLTETVTLDMATGRLSSATDPNGDALWQRVSIDSQLFDLKPGRNSIEFAMVGSTVDSMVHVTYAPRFLAGY